MLKILNSFFIKYFFVFAIFIFSNSVTKFDFTKSINLNFNKLKEFDLKEIYKNNKKIIIAIFGFLFLNTAENIYIKRQIKLFTKEINDSFGNNNLEIVHNNEKFSFEIKLNKKNEFTFDNIKNINKSLILLKNTVDKSTLFNYMFMKKALKNKLDYFFKNLIKIDLNNIDIINDEKNKFEFDIKINEFVVKNSK